MRVTVVTCHVRSPPCRAPPSSLARRTDDRGPQPLRPGPLGRLAGLAYRRRGRTVLAWLAALALAVGLSAAFGGEFTADYSAPGSDSSRAQDLLEERFPASAGDTVDVVVRADDAVSAARRHAPRSRALLAELGAPAARRRRRRPVRDTRRRSPRTAAPWSRRLRLDVVNPDDMPIADTERMLEIAEDASAARAEGRPRRPDHPAGRAGRDRLGGHRLARRRRDPADHVRLGGRRRPADPAWRSPGSRSARRSPAVLIAVVDAPDWSTSLATMMGIGIGIDYVLLMVTRFREWRAAGPRPGGRDRRHARHRRPGGAGRRQHRAWSACSACSRWACRSCAAPRSSRSSASSS